MHIAYHIGAHCTGGETIVRSLRRNLDRVPPGTLAAPPIHAYHAPLRDMVNDLAGAPASPAAQTSILARLTGDRPAARLVLSNQSFICVPDRALEEGRLYPLMYKVAWLRNLFPDHPVSFHICLRDPATFLPALFRIQQAETSFERFIGRIDLRQIRWSDPIARLLEACPEAEVTIWCYEDSPLIWERVIRSLGGIDEDVALHGMFDMAGDIMEKAGMAKLRAYVAKRPPASRDMRQKVIAAFIDKFARPEAMAEERPVASWDEAFCARLTRQYEEDLARILSMDRVRALTR